MMRKFLLLTIALFSTSVFSAELDKKLHEECLYPTIMVCEHPTGNGGTGTIVRSEKIEENVYCNVAITCEHIFSAGTTYSVRIPQYENWSKIKGFLQLPAYPYSKSDDFDMGIICFLSQEQMPTAKMNFDEPLFIGSEIFKIGCGLEDIARVDYGKITGMNIFMQESIHDTLRISAYTVTGDSGCSLFHNYEIVGIIVSIRNGTSPFAPPYFNIAYAKPIKQFKEWNNIAENSVEFIYNKEKSMPVLPSIALKYGLLNTSVKFENYWEKK